MIELLAETLFTETNQFVLEVTTHITERLVLRLCTNCLSGMPLIDLRLVFSLYCYRATCMFKKRKPRMFIMNK